MNVHSEINPILTLDYITNEHENKYFDRKSAKIKPSDLAQHISAFANAGGGTLVLGINDKTHALEGINSVSEDKINEFINSPKQCCKPMPDFKEEFLDIINENGQQDRLLLLHIFETQDQIIRTANDQTYLRIGDKSREMRGDDLRNLEYARNTRRYEDEICPDATLSDLDEALLEKYKEVINAEGLPSEQVLSSRGFMKEIDGKQKLTNAAVLLFARNIMQFYPNCRIRFVRYNGNYAGVGASLNIIKDFSIDEPILKIIVSMKKFISGQLRDFTVLDENTGKFETIPEYPEFAWQEGIINAVTHREYALSGNFILVKMFDDRMEIESPGKLPVIVTVENIKNTRFSRNPRISRVLTEFSWVRELNEGVKRIYKDMNKFFLDPPEYSEPGYSVKLTLKNNILIRTNRQRQRIEKLLGNSLWETMDSLERQIITYLFNHGPATRNELENYTGKARNTIMTRMKKLIAADLANASGTTNDPSRKYSLTAWTEN